MAFAAGMLVELHSLDSAQLNGVQAQLIRYDRLAKKWIAATFDGQMITVDERFVRSSQELTVDLVMGPRSDYNLSGTTLAESLSSKGFATVKLLVSQSDAADMLETAKHLDATGKFSRLPTEFERGYLGLDGMAKTCEIYMDDEDLPEFVKQSSLKAMEENFANLSDMLNENQEALGFELYSRTGLLMRMPLTPQEESFYPAEAVGDGDAEDFLKLMYRRRITAMQFVGPAAGTVKLFSTPEAKAAGMTSEIEIAVEPHTMLLFLSSRWELSYKSFGRSLTLQTFFLVEPVHHQILEAAAADPESSPPLPGLSAPDKQYSVVGSYNRYGMNSQGRDQFFLGSCKAGVDGITEIPLTRWDHSLYWDPESDGTGNKMYCRHGCYGIDHVEMFDNKFFEIGNVEAAAMDPMQRQVMEVSYTALHEVGYNKQSLARNSTCIGHFVGIDKAEWSMLADAVPNFPQALRGTSSCLSIISGRFSYLFNLKGPSMVIDTACSSSLVCVHMNKLTLQDKTQDVDPVVANVVHGINLNLHPFSFQFTCAAGMISHMGRCFTFNSSADGYCRGEASGALVCKEQIFNPDEGSIALLAGSNVNQDGRSASLTAPNGPSQSKAIRAVLRECKLMPAEIDCSECHGTGTSLGDPIEIGSLRKVMSSSSRVEPLCITSSKSNIGHGEGSAGLAGFMKCIVQASHAEAGPNMHLRCMNPHIDMDGFEAIVLTESSIASRTDSSQIGVSSYGFSGTNCHAEAWGRNIYTSRGALAVDQNKAAKKRLSMSMPATHQVFMKGEDFRQWTISGPHPGKPGQYKVAVDTEGNTNFEYVDEDLEDWGEDFAIRGTWSEWQIEPLTADDTIAGLWSCSVTIGQSGVEQFQIVADEEKIYYPATENCSSMAAEVWGPGRQAVTGKTWLMQGKPGAEYRIEFFQRKARKSVLWLAA